MLGTVAILLLFVTPLQDAIVWFDQAYEDNEGRPLPAPAGVFLFGFICAYFLQLTAKSVLGCRLDVDQAMSRHSLDTAGAGP